MLKSNGYPKISTKVAPNFMLKLMSNFNRDIKGMRAFIGNTYSGNVSHTLKTFDWKPVPFDKTIIDTAASVEQAMK